MKTKFLKQLLLLLFFNTILFYSHATDYLQVRFSSDAVIPSAAASGDSILLHFNDSNLDAVFNGYRITAFNKVYPSVSRFPGNAAAAELARVYAIRVASNLNLLITQLSIVASSDLTNFYLASNEVVALSEPNDYYNVTNGSGWPTASNHLDLINAKGAWEITKGLSCIKVGIIDFDFQHHVDLDNNVIFSPPTNAVIGIASTISSHGNEVAGMVAAETNNNLGISALGYNIKMRYYATYPYSNNTSDPNFDVALNAILDAVADGCKVINCSWYSQWSTSNQTPNANEQAIIDFAFNNNVTVVVAAGNCNLGYCNTKFYPASYNHAISVTSVGSQYEEGIYVAPGVARNWKDYFRWGMNPSDPYYYKTHQYNTSVDLNAPGHYVSTTGHNNGYVLNVGTSLAAPQVAAAAGLLYSLNQNFTPTQVEYYLKQSAFNSYSIADNNNWAGKIGVGRLDAGAALNLAANSSTGGCEPRFSNINWYRQNRSGSFVQLTNNYDAFTYLNAATNNSLQFSISNNPTANVEWEFYLNGRFYSTSGSNITINLNSFSLISNPSNTPNIPNTLNYTERAPLYCLNTLEVYVRQGSGCCYSAYYKEDASNPNCIVIKGGVKNIVEAKASLPIVEKSKLQIYPNPAKNIITVVADITKIEKPIDYQIIGIDGKVVKSGKLVNNSSSLNISKLPNGVYLFKSIIGNTKFIKE
jgi:hypothetical protein